MSANSSQAASPIAAEGARLRKACRACFSAKVKCTRGAPCERCAVRGWECVAEAEAKRGRPRLDERAPETAKAVKVAGDALSATSASGSGAFWRTHQNWTSPPSEVSPSLPSADVLAASTQGTAAVERRLLRVFFALFKHHRKSRSTCSRRWFSLQVGKLWAEWSARGVRTGEIQERFLRWADQQDLHLASSSSSEAVAPTQPRALGALAPKFSQMTGVAPSTPVEEAAAPSEPSCPTRPPLDPSHGSAPYLRVFSTHEGTLFEMSAEFESAVGVSKSKMNQVFMWTRDGFLPWGADALAMFVDSDEAVLRYLAQCSESFARLAWPSTLPATRRVRLSHETRLAPLGDGRNALDVRMRVSVIENLAAERTSVDVTFELLECAGDARAASWRTCAPDHCRRAGHAPGSSALDWIEPAMPNSPFGSDEAILEFLESL